uniref:bifunctional heptose 7-phosphate kinase/heptose 1-phosphate adenyltransferase n=1 Tax=Tianweitania sp. TaxID=2021634 RepID=UPI003A102C9E
MIVDDFHGKRILVVGDIMLDHFVRGSVERVSPEAPALVLRIQSDYWAVGGAGNVATNVSSLGGIGCLVGVVGADDAARRIDILFDRDANLENHLVTYPGWPTIEKTRFIAGDNHLLRADREGAPAIARAVEEELVQRIEAAAATCDAIILSDYAKGVVTPAIIGACVLAGRAHGIPV